MPEIFKKVLIFGYIGYGNAGDELILLATLKKLKPFCTEITVLSADPKATAEYFGVNAVKRGGFFSLIREIAAADTVYCGGGGIFQDKSSGRSIWYYAAIVFIAKLLGKKLILVHQGVGPLNRKLSRSLTRMAFNNIHLASVRDVESAELLEKIGVDISRIEVSGDAVMEMVLARNIKNKKFKKVIFALRAWEDIERCTGTITETADYLRLHGVLFEFVAFQPPQDNLIGLEIDFERDVKKLIKEISTADLIVGARFHSLVLAYLHGIPFIGINFDSKIESFCRKHKAPLIGTDEKEFKNNFKKSIIKAMEKAGRK